MKPSMRMEIIPPGHLFSESPQQHPRRLFDNRVFDVHVNMTSGGLQGSTTADRRVKSGPQTPLPASEDALKPSKHRDQDLRFDFGGMVVPFVMWFGGPSFMVKIRVSLNRFASLLRNMGSSLEGLSLFWFHHRNRDVLSLLPSAILQSPFFHGKMSLGARTV